MIADELPDLSGLSEVVLPIEDVDAPMPNECEPGNRKKSTLHCCVPLCTGDARYNQELSFHRFPNDAALKSVWINKIRRDEGPYFKVNVKYLRQTS